MAGFHCVKFIFRLFLRRSLPLIYFLRLHPRLRRHLLTLVRRAGLRARRGRLLGSRLLLLQRHLLRRGHPLRLHHHLHAMVGSRWRCAFYAGNGVQGAPAVPVGLLLPARETAMAPAGLVGLPED